MGMPTGVSRGDNPRPGNPDPRNFEVIRDFVQGDFIALEIRYPGCTNFEGRKILIIQNTRSQSLGFWWITNLLSGPIDPHFQGLFRERYRLPARFEPSTWGWERAQQLVSILQKEVLGE